MIFFYQLFSLISVFSALLVTVLTLSLSGTVFFLIPFLPACYVLFNMLILLVTWRTGPSLFLLICLPTAFLRYVVFPGLTAINGGYQGRSHMPPLETSYNTAVFLMCYELIAVGLLIAILEPRYHRKNIVINNIEGGLPFWYVMVVLTFSLFMVFVSPISILLINFLQPVIQIDENVLPPFAVLTAMTLMATKVIIFLWLLRRLAKATRWKKLMPSVVVLLCVLNILVYFGTNRLSMILTCIASIWVFRQYFTGRLIVQTGFITVAAIILFSIITGERDYTSISETRSVRLADTIQGYTGGVYNVAIGVEVPLYYPEARDFSVLVYDIVRPTFGLNLIAKKWSILYSNIYYNYRMWTHVDRRSQIMPMIAQGHLFFYTLFAPFLSLFFVWLGYQFLSLINKVNYIEIRYALVLVVLRLGFFWGQNIMNMMNFLSINLIIPLIIIIAYLIFKFLSKKNFAFDIIKK